MIRRVHRQYLHVGDRTIAYFDSAPDEPGWPVALLVHGFPLSALMWEPQFRQPPKGWRLLAPDLRGFGGSTDPGQGAPGDIDDYAADVVDLISELGIPSAVVGGLSMGGYVTLAVLRRAPAIVRAVVLADTRATADTREGRAGRRAMLAQVEREGASGVASSMLPKLIAATTRDTHSDVESLVRRMIKQQSPDAIRGAIQRMMDRPDSTALAASLSIPALVIVGAEDALTPPDDARALAASIANAELVVLAGAGHLSNLEQPEAFNERLEAFLSRIG